MDSNEGCFFGAVVALCICAFLLFMAYSEGRISAIEEQRQAAIDHNCAEWRIDAKTGQREFVWLGKGLPTEGESDGK